MSAKIEAGDGWRILAASEYITPYDEYRAADGRWMPTDCAGEMAAHIIGGVYGTHYAYRRRLTSDAPNNSGQVTYLTREESEKLVQDMSDAKERRDRRERIATAMMSGLLANSARDCAIEDDVTCAMGCADALIAALDGGKT